MRISTEKGERGFFENEAPHSKLRGKKLSYVRCSEPLNVHLGVM